MTRKEAFQLIADCGSSILPPSLVPLDTMLEAMGVIFGNNPPLQKGFKIMYALGKCHGGQEMALGCGVTDEDADENT